MLRRSWVFACVGLFACNGSSITDGGDAVGSDTNLVDVLPMDMGTDAPADAGTDGSAAGQPCMTATQCGPGSWECYTPVVNGLCTHTCTQSTSQTTEQLHCGGPGSTCVTIGDGASATGYCEASCNVADGARACRPGFVCTGWWFTHANGMPDRTGCWTHCATDADCAPGMPCNPRSGVCGDTPVDPSLRADGEPCNPMDTSGMNVSNECRSRQCFSESVSDPTAGVCGSLIATAVTARCPDPGVTAVTRMDDGIGLCLFRSCVSDCDCTAPLVCHTSPFGTNTVCLWPPTGITSTCSDGGTGDAATDATATDAASGG